MNDKYYCVIDANGYYTDLVLAADVPGPGNLILDLGDLGAADMSFSSWENVGGMIPENELAACKAVSNCPYMGGTEDGRVFCYAPGADGKTAALVIVDQEHDAVFRLVGPLTRSGETLTLKNEETDAALQFTFQWREGGMIEQIQGYTLAEGESLVPRTDECGQPTGKPYAGAPGFVRPKWDGTAWVEGATEEQITAWELEHPAPEASGLNDLTLTQLAVAELAQVVEDNNTANQLAIAELAESLLGGEPNGETLL